MTKPAAGPAVYRRVVRELRGELADKYGLPMREYFADVESYTIDEQPVLWVKFTRRTTLAEVIVKDITVADNGKVQLYGIVEMR